MTKRDYDLSEAAENDLVGIWNYIADDNPKAADGFIDKLSETMDLLADMPHMGRTCSDLGVSYRSFPVGNYVIFYSIEGERICILHIVHGRRDIDHYPF